MNMRKITSLTTMLAFALLMLTGVVLYITPHGRVAYWSDWRLWGLSKTQWGDIHINFGLLFMISGCLHVYYNWKPIVSYLKNKARRVTVFTKNFNLALGITVIVAAGTYLHMPPLVWVLDGAEAIKDAASEKYGEPPYGHAELSSLKTFTQKMGYDLEKSLAALKDKGIRVQNPQQSLLEIAAANNTTPKQIDRAMKPAAASVQPGRLPATPSPGVGRQSLAALCKAYGLALPDVLKGLEAQKIHATGETSIRAIAEERGVSPVDIYEIIRVVVEGLAPAQDG